ncbi:beta-galactosidase [Ruminococcus sp. 5_1_39BFAA]|uniref:beta-galactosidase n=1 Tax=Ruminococcus sp. 5_1_39BFAA TaxID=457412 RepID=UPI0035639C93
MTSNENGFLCDRTGKPVFLTGLQCHNSSSGTEMIDRTIEAIHQYGGNLLEAPVYWCEVEKEKDCYDMSLVAGLVDKAREAGLYLIPLWFGASKNGLFTYAPDYVKRNSKEYKRAKNSAGIQVESLSPHCRATLERDRKAFCKVMEFLKKYDTEGTVIAVQVENEMGLVHTDRDYSREAEEEFLQPVPLEICCGQAFL